MFHSDSQISMRSLQLILLFTPIGYMIHDMFDEMPVISLYILDSKLSFHSGQWLGL